MRLIYSAVALGLLAASWLRYRSLLHPHFIVSLAMVLLLYSDYMVRADQTIVELPFGDIGYYQILILLIPVATSFACWLLDTAFRRRRSESPQAFEVTSAMLRTAWIIVGIEILKRLVASNWSPTLAIEYTFAARGSAPWRYGQGNIGDANFIYSIVSLVVPFAGLVFAGAALTVPRRLSSWLGLLLVVTILTGDGSRTPLALVLGGSVVFVLLSARTRLFKVLHVTGAMTLGALLFSAMITFRSEGLGQLASSSGMARYELVYHQDDNYTNALRALYISDMSPERWDAAEFFYATVVNPIPRVFWEEKPLLTQEFWGSYKNEWITISYVGESAALFGPVWGTGFCILFGCVVFLVLRRASSLARRPRGLLVYLTICLYAYMVMRSMQNLSMSVYLPMFALVVYHLGSWHADITRAGRMLRNTKPSGGLRVRLKPASPAPPSGPLRPWGGVAERSDARQRVRSSRSGSRRH